MVVKGLATVAFIEAVGSGLNVTRKRFLKRMDAIGRRGITTLLLAHRDRLTRIGVAWFARDVATHRCEVWVLNQERRSLEQEMAQDLMTIIHRFSSRLNGLRNDRNRCNEALQQSAAGGDAPCN